MKIFQINTVCGSGSAGRIAVDLAHMLEEHGDECCIAFSRGNKSQRMWTAFNLEIRQRYTGTGL